MTSSLFVTARANTYQGKASDDKHKNNQQNIPQRPEPSPLYLDIASEKCETLEANRPLPLVLDLNGTLLCRKGQRNFVTRPGAAAFLEYAFTKHRVMIWASSRAETVTSICESLLSEWWSDLVAIWTRDRLRLPHSAVSQKTQVYKQLGWLWADEQIQRSRDEECPLPWSQKNTILIDDSPEKGASEPYNVVVIDSFHGDGHDDEHKTFDRLMTYIDDLGKQQNVSSFIKSHPFGAVEDTEDNAHNGAYGG